MSDTSSETSSDKTATRRRLDRLRRVRLINARRPLRALLAVGGLIGLATLVAVIFAVSQRGVSQSLVDADPDARTDLLAALTVRSIDPVRGELGIRVTPRELGQDRTEAGVVTRDFSVLVNDLSGQTTYTFQEGEPVRPIDFRVALDDGSVFAYPFDTYSAGILVLAADGTDSATGAPLSVEVVATSTLLDFDLSATTEDCFDSTCLTVDVRRPLSTIGYTLWFIVLVWGLALAGLGVLATTIGKGVEIPLWSFGYLVGVLFALPPLRSSLPASPPPGGFVDFVAFYGATALVGTTLLALIAMWIREARQPRLPDAADG